MPSSLVKTVNFGSTKTGLADFVGYRLIDSSGLVAQERTQLGIYETYMGTGIYAANIEFPDDFTGTILWDIEGTRPVYAAEEFNNSINGTGVSRQVNEVTTQVTEITEQVNSVTTQVGLVSDQVTDLADEIRFIRGMTAGRWSLDKKTSTMTYYDESGKNVLVTYEMLDEDGKPSIESVYDRRIKNAITMIKSLADQQNVIAELQADGTI